MWLIYLNYDVEESVGYFHLNCDVEERELVTLP